MTDGGPVREHYASEGITERVLTALRNANGPDVPITPQTLAPIDHFHGKGVVATEELVAELQKRAHSGRVIPSCVIISNCRRQSFNRCAVLLVTNMSTTCRSGLSLSIAMPNPAKEISSRC